MCFPKKSDFVGNLLTVKAHPDKPSHVAVYEALINLLTTSDQWVLDPRPIGGGMCNY